MPKHARMAMLGLRCPLWVDMTKVVRTRLNLQGLIKEAHTVQYKYCSIEVNDEPANMGALLLATRSCRIS